MKIAKVSAVLAFLLNLIAMAFLGGAGSRNEPDDTYTHYNLRSQFLRRERLPHRQ
jgi:hypothetical protein